MKKVLLLIPAIAMAAAGCVTAPTPIPEPDSAAAQLYTSKCGACHALPHPKRNSYPEWQHLLTLMQRRMAERGMPALTREEEKTLLEYLQRHAR